MSEPASRYAPRRLAVSAFFLIVAILFLIANRGAYKGYFQGDSLDSLGWAPRVPVTVFAKLLVSPLYQTNNFRPVGHFYFHVMGRLFGLDFPKYLVPLHLLHLFNVWLLWMLLRRLGASRFAAGLGAFFFAFQMAVLDVYWKPMYVFDLLCATFSLACLLFWVERRWVLAFVAFWLAYKSKELAVMLPAVLACYELWLGKRLWKPLALFFLVSLSFGLQGIFMAAGRSEAYTLDFTLPAIVTSSAFYANALFQIPLAGLAVLALPLLSRDRRVWLGVAATVLLFGPLLFLPHRLLSAYWYVPLIGLSIALSALAGSRYRLAVALLVAACIPWSYGYLRHYRRGKLAADDLTRTYVRQLQAAAPSLQQTPLFLYDHLPPKLYSWGVHGALSYLIPNLQVRAYPLDGPAAGALLSSPQLAILDWRGPSRLWIVKRTPATPDASYIMMDDPQAPIWQLLEGWRWPQEGYRWISPHASARLFRPPQATRFEVTCVISAQLIQALGHSQLRVRMDGLDLGTAQLTAPGFRTVSWPLPAGPAGPVTIDFDAQPAWRVPGGPQGIGIQRFGFR
jgi:hypothetical protein